jgi:hypothetical protein
MKTDLYTKPNRKDGVLYEFPMKLGFCCEERPTEKPSGKGLKVSMSQFIALLVVVAVLYGGWNLVLSAFSKGRRGRVFGRFCVSLVVVIALGSVGMFLDEQRLVQLQAENPVEYQRVMAAKAAEQRQSEEQRRVREEAQRQAELDQQKSGQHCLSGGNGSQRRLVGVVKQNLRNPSSFEHVATRITPRNEHGEHGVVMQYRAENGFGGMSLGMVTALVRSSDCTVIEWTSV